MAEILVVDDDAELAGVVRHVLTHAGHDAEVAVGGAAAIAAINRRTPDLVLLDMEMPDVDGPGVLSAIRSPDGSLPVPVVLFTATEEAESVAGLRAGAVDFVRKGVDATVLLARVARALRRERSHWITAGRLRIDLRSQRAWMDERELVLEHRRYGLLAYLASRAGTVVSRDELLREVWGTGWNGLDHAVDQAIYSLRRTLGEPGWIETVTRRGYRLVARA